MHRYRRAAKYAAWYDQEEPTTYNPFRKARTNPRSDLYRVQSDSEREEGIRRANTLDANTGLGRSFPHADSAPSLQRVESSIPEERATTDVEQISQAVSKARTSSSLGAWPLASQASGIKSLLSKKKKVVEGILHDEEKFEKSSKLEITAASQFRTVFLNSWVNVLLLAVPAGFALRYRLGYSITTFVVNFVAGIPLVLLVGLGADEIQVRVGITLGSLINVCASNVAQFITSILLLRSRQILVLQTGLIGGILCSVLLVLGLSFFVGGIERPEQNYNPTLAHTSANMLSLASTSLLVPTVSRLLKQSSEVHIARQSRGAAIILLAVYFAYIVFQLHTHPELWARKDEKVAKRPRGKKEKGEVVRGVANIGGSLAATIQGDRVPPMSTEDDDDIDDIAFPSLSLPVAVLTLIVSTVILTFNTDFAVNSIDKLSSDAHLSKNFIGLVLLPVLNNIDPGPMLFAMKDRVTVTIGITVGKCLQTALLITPLMVIVGWGLGIDTMTLYFDGFEVASLFSSVILLNYLIIDAKSTWIQGVLLVGDWCMIALAAFFADT